MYVGCGPTGKKVPGSSFHFLMHNLKTYVLLMILADFPGTCFSSSCVFRYLLLMNEILVQVRKEKLLSSIIQHIILLLHMIGLRVSTETSKLNFYEILMSSYCDRCEEGGLCRKGR